MSNYLLVDVAVILATIFAGVGLILSAIQLRNATRERRVSKISDALLKLFDDKELSDIYYQIEYDKFIYDEEFHCSPDEKKLDRLLALFDTLAKLRSARLFKKKDLDLIAYEYLVVYQNESVRKYLAFLDEWFKKRGVKTQPFIHYRRVGKEIEEFIIVQ